MSINEETNIQANVAISALVQYLAAKNGPQELSSFLLAHADNAEKNHVTVSAAGFLRNLAKIAAQARGDN